MSSCGDRSTPARPFADHKPDAPCTPPPGHSLVHQLDTQTTQLSFYVLLPLPPPIHIRVIKMGTTRISHGLLATMFSKSSRLQRNSIPLPWAAPHHAEYKSQR